MGLLETIIQAGGKSAVSQVAGKVGLDESTTAAAMAMLLPQITNGIGKNVANPTGLGALLSALQGGSHANYLDNPASLGAPEAVADGNGILGHILGSKDVSRGIASVVAQQLGISESTVKAMLPLVAAMAMGGLAKQAKTAQIAPPEPQAPNVGDLLGSVTKMLGTEGIGSMLPGLFK